jgi:hypothetical protein
MTRYFPEIVSRGLDRVHGRLSQPPVDIDPALGTLLAVWVDARRIELPIARTFVEAHWRQIRPGGGARCVLSLPAASATHGRRRRIQQAE